MGRGVDPRMAGHRWRVDDSAMARRREQVAHMAIQRAFDPVLAAAVRFLFSKKKWQRTSQLPDSSGSSGGSHRHRQMGMADMPAGWIYWQLGGGTSCVDVPWNVLAPSKHARSVRAMNGRLSADIHLRKRPI